MVVFGHCVGWPAEHPGVKYVVHQLENFW